MIKFQILDFRQLRILLVSIFVVALVGLIAISRFKSLPAVAAWWNDAWTYRNAVPVTAHTAAESNVYVSVTVNSSSNFQADCGDMRWTDEGGSVLPYYIVSGCGGASTVTHVLLKSFPAGAQTLYYYYGNPSAANGFSAADFATEAINYTIGTIGSQEKSNGPVAYWDFNEGTGTVASDRTGNGNNGTLTGGPTWQAPSACISDDCLSFNGTTDYVSVSHSSSLNLSTAMTLSAWIKPTGTQVSDAQVISKNGAYGLAIPSGTSMKFYFWGDTNSVNYTFNSGTWYYLSATYDGTNKRFYINGNLIYTIAAGSAPTSSNALQIGSLSAYGASEYFSGFIDEPKIYNYARSAEQIKADYNNRLSEMEGTGAVLGAENSNALNQGLVGYWKMDESSWDGTAGEVRDASGNGNNGVAVNGATTAGGKFGNGGSFDGTNDTVDVNTSAGAISSDKLTVSAWFKADTISDDIGILGKANNSNWNNGYGIYTDTSSGNSVRFFVNNYSTNVGVSSAILTATWYHVVGVYDGTSVSVYLNGVRGTDDSYSGNVSDGGTFQIGTLGGWANEFDGMVDEVRVYNRALSPAEVQQLYQFAPGPVAYYNFEEGSGSTVNDASSYGNTGTWTGSGSRWLNGKVGKSAKFNGSDDLVNFGNASSLNVGGTTSSYTVGAWVKTTQSAVRQFLNKYTAGDGKYPINLVLMANGKTEFVIYDGTNVPEAISTSTINDGRWHYLTGVRDVATDKLYIYVDGILEASTTDTTTATTANNSSVILGKDTIAGVATWFNGEVDEVKIYNYARTPAQINQDMRGTGPTLPNLGGLSRGAGGVVGWWDFDEGTGTVAKDRSGRGNNGTINGAVWNQNGKINKALSFDGTDDYVTFGGSNSLDMRQSFTACGFVKLSSAGGSQVFLGKGRDSTSTYSYVFEAVYSGGAPRFEIYDGGSNPGVSATTVLGAGTWSHLCGTYDGKNLKIYVNSNLENSTATTIDPGANSSDFVIGKWPNASNYYLNGQVDEVKIYNYALTAEEVKTEFNQGKALVLGSFSDTSQVSGGSVASNSASAIYCVPGSSESCAPPVAEWNFEEGAGTSVADTSGNANTGTWNGTAPFWTQGKSGWGGKFNGSDGYINVGDSSSLNLALGYTISFWLKTNINTTGVILVRRPSASTTWNYAIATNDAGGYLRLTTASSGYNLTTNVLDNKWHHIEVVVTTGGAVQWYVDGIARDSYTGATTTAGSAVLCIGENATNSTTCANSFLYSGILDQVRIFNYARSAAQIAWDYNRGKPVASWDFDECQGTTVNDSSGNGNVGTLTNASVGTCAESGSTSWYLGRTGKFNASVYFDGSNDYVSVADSNSLDLTSAFTISAWGNLAGTGAEGDSVVLSKGLTASAENYSLYVQDDGDIGLEYYNGGWHSKIFSVPSFSTGTWYHYVLTYDGTNLRAYRNGALLGVQALSSSPVANSGTLQIGGVTAYNNRWQGQLDDVAIYNYALTPVQVKQVYNGEFGVRFGPTSGTP